MYVGTLYRKTQTLHVSPQKHIRSHTHTHTHTHVDEDGCLFRSLRCGGKARGETLRGLVGVFLDEEVFMK